jgi:hypothetical protein
MTFVRTSTCVLAGAASVSSKVKSAIRLQRWRRLA